MATTRQLMNKVLRGLRQNGLIIASGTTSTTDDYLLLILQFVNEAKEEIEEAGWAWRALRKTVTVTLAAGTVEYDLTIAGAADVDTNDRSRLLYENVTMHGANESFYNSASSSPQVFDVTDNDEYRLTERTQEHIERLHFTDEDETDSRVQYFSWYSDGDSIKIKVWPTPSEARTLKIRAYIPQAELADDSLEATTLSIPSRPVWTLALFKANQERGDELGKEGSAAHRAYLDAHGAAAGNEMTAADITVNLER